MPGRMRRVARKLFAAGSALSLLLLAATCLLWVRSYRNTDQLEWRSASGFRGIGSGSGYVVMQLNLGDNSSFAEADYGLRYLRMEPYTAPHYPVAYGHLLPQRTFATWELGDFGWYTVRDTAGLSTTTAVAPFWSFAALTLILPLSWTAARIRRYIRARHCRSAGFCRTCGYDLRATPQRCPECGTVAVS